MSQPTEFLNVQTLLEALDVFCYRDEAYNNLFWGIVLRWQHLPTLPGGWRIWALQAADQWLALLHQPGRQFLFAGSQQAEALLSPLLEQVAPLMPEVSGFVGPRYLTEPLLAARFGVTTPPLRQQMPQGIFQLEQAPLKPQVPGHARWAQGADQALLTQWLQDFLAEALPHEPHQAADLSQSIRHKITEQQLMVWEQAGQIRAMAAWIRPTWHGVAVNLVYTPPAERGQGFAAACVSALSQRQLEMGFCFCCLFTDLANPVSNRLYERLGYRKIGEYTSIFWD